MTSRISLAALSMVLLVACGSSAKKAKTTPDRPIVASTKPIATPAPVPEPTPTADPAPAADPDAGLWSPIYFEFDSPTLSAEAKQRLTRVADYLKQHPKARLLIGGNADERGTNEYNLALGDERARAARDFVNRLGIAPARLRTISYGEERPVVSGDDDGSRAQNRRDELSLE